MSTHIGIVTKQNTGNLTPAIQMRARKIIAIESDFARKKEWKEGYINVAKRFGINNFSLESYSNSESLDVAYMIKQLRKVCDEHDELVFNVTGGRKPQQLALWNLFIERLRNDYERDKAVYVSFNEGVARIEIWRLADGELVHDTIDCDVSYSIEDLISLANLEVLNQDYTLIYANNKPTDWLAEDIRAPDLLNNSDFRSFLFRLGNAHPEGIDHDIESYKDIIDEIKNFKQPITYELHKSVFEKYLAKTLESVLRKKDLAAAINQIRRLYERMGDKDSNLYKTIINTFISSLRNIAHNTFETPIIRLSDFPSLQPYFNGETEILLTSSTFKEITGFDKPSFYFEDVLQQRIVNLLKPHDQNYVSEIAANVTITQNGQSVGEHDILISTKFGTLISIDAKVFTVEKKDFDARLYNMLQSGGTYAKFMIAFPFFAEDIDKGVLPKEINENLDLFIKMKRDFYALGNAQNKRMVNASNEYFSNQNIQIKNFDYILDDLNLI